MRNVVVIALKDLRLRLRDRSAWIAVLITPLVIACIATFAFDQLDRKVPSGRPARLAFANDDLGLAGAGLEGAFAEPPLRDVVALRVVKNETEVRELVADGDADTGLIVPAEFSQAAVANDELSLTIVEGAGRPIQNAIAQVIADAFLAQVGAARQSVQTALAVGAGAPQVFDLTNQVALARIPLQITDSETSGRRASPASYFGSSMAILALFFGVAFTGKSLWVERNLGLVTRIEATPATLHQVVIGKAMASTLIGFGSAMVMWFTVSVAFNTSWGPPRYVLLLLLAMAAAAMGITLFVASVARNEQIFDALSAVIGFSFGVIGGNFVPFHRLPPPFDTLSKVTPNSWALQGFADINAGAAAFRYLWAPVLAMVGFGIVFGLAGVSRLEMRMRR